MALKIIRRVLNGGQVLILRGPQTVTKGALDADVTKALAKKSMTAAPASDSHWITKDGTHILINGAGQAISGSPEFRQQFNASLASKGEAAPQAAPQAPPQEEAPQEAPQETTAPQAQAAPPAERAAPPAAPTQLQNESPTAQAPQATSTESPVAPEPEPSVANAPQAQPDVSGTPEAPSAPGAGQPGPSPVETEHAANVDAQEAPGIHAKHAAALRDRAASLPNTPQNAPKRAALERAAKTLDHMDADGSQESMDGLNMDHRGQRDRLGLDSQNGRIVSAGMQSRSGDDFNELRGRARAANGDNDAYERADRAAGTPGRFNLPEAGLHNALENMHEFNASPALLARGSELHDQGKMTPRIGGVIHPPEATSAAPEPAATPQSEAPSESQGESQSAPTGAAPEPSAAPAPEASTGDAAEAQAESPQEAAQEPGAGETEAKPGEAPTPEPTTKPGELPTSAKPDEAYRQAAPPPPGFDQPNMPLQTAAAVLHLDDLGNPLVDRPYSAVNVEAMNQQPSTDGMEVDTATALENYANELHGHAARTSEAADNVANARGRGWKAEARELRIAAKALTNAAYSARNYARYPERMESDNEYHDKYKSDNEIGVHAASGKGTISHRALDYWGNARALTDEEKAKFSTLNGYKSPTTAAGVAAGGKHAFAIDDLHSAIKTFPHHAVHPNAILAGAREFAKRSQAIQPWKAPSTWKGKNNGGMDLMPYQQYAAMYAASKNAALLALDMGLGKTATSIAAFSRMKAQGKVSKAMVFCPNSVMSHWAKEIGDLTTHKVGVYRSQAVVRGLSPAAQAQYHKEMAEADVIVCGHGQFIATSEQDAHENKLRAAQDKLEMARHNGSSQLDIAKASEELSKLQDQKRVLSDEGNLDQLKGYGCDSLIMDEAHAIKNPSSNKARDFESHMGDMKHKLLLTGTPMPNTPTDLYNMLERVRKGAVATSEASFVHKYIRRTIGVTRTGKKWKRDDAYRNLDDLFNKTKQDMLAIHSHDPHVRAQQRDLGIYVPDGTHEVRSVGMSGAQDALYKMFMDAGEDILNDLNPNAVTDKQKEKMKTTLGMRLEQIAIDPSMIKREDVMGDGIVASDRQREMKALFEQCQRESQANGGTAKLREMAETAMQHHTNGGKGTVIHINYTSAIPAIRRALLQQGFTEDEIGELSGNITSAARRKQNIANFNNPKHPSRVMIVTSAAREGVNLQGSNREHGPNNTGGGSLDIMLSHDWLPGNEDQARARIERIGQDQKTHHVVLHATRSNGGRTLDQFKHRRLTAKAEAIRQAVLGKPGAEVEIPQTGFSDEDWRDFYADSDAGSNEDHDNA